ncbi:hypothetical protein Acr_04g0001570 [Actinidia rufa]|uniref:Uncharacterized protein n=1 Tax=Actinidia rufa TaxID=165716 RepID=A0A7J0EHN4_9ERIC|nr:hypothetical protein Acr_04g0001570 [Actinidia rufa]
MVLVVVRKKPRRRKAPRSGARDLMDLDSQGPRHGKREEEAELLKKFTMPKFNLYDGRINPYDHLSHYNQMMVLWKSNNALMCKVFLSKLGEIELHWCDKLVTRSIRIWRQLFEIFAARKLHRAASGGELQVRSKSRCFALLALHVGFGGQYGQVDVEDRATCSVEEDMAKFCIGLSSPKRDEKKEDRIREKRGRRLGDGEE